MSHLREMRLAFYREVVGHGITHPEQFKGAFPLGYEVPKERLEIWLRRFHKVRTEFSPQRRYVNRFKIGADPEFVFTLPPDPLRPDAERRADATLLGLKQGPAFGADNNGRLAEIRPHPSRSALEVCASVLSTLRWLAVLAPPTMQYQWQAGAYLFRDGLGGHVHFGRKRPTRAVEVRALDNVNELLILLGVYPYKECTARRKGDARGQRYGQPGDFRLQTHGYEYRTFPSWLDSPELAFITMTLAKLAVYDPGLVVPFQDMAGEPEVQRQKVINLLAYYRDVDDDARLAHIMYQSKLPLHLGGDFRQRWGLMAPPSPFPPNVTIVPSSIAPSEEDVTEVFNSFFNRRPLQWRTPVPTWSPVKPPEGYVMCLDSVNTHQVKGLGEMVLDLCCSTQIPIVEFQGGNGGPPLGLSDGLIRMLPKDWKNRFEGLAGRAEDTSRLRVYVHHDWREGGNARIVKRMILKHLPVWKVGEVKPESFERWQAAGKLEPQGKFSGKVVCEVGRQLL